MPTGSLLSGTTVLLDIVHKNRLLGVEAEFMVNILKEGGIGFDHVQHMRKEDIVKDGHIVMVQDVLPASIIVIREQIEVIALLF